MSFDPNFQNEPPTPPPRQPPADGLATPAGGPASTIRQKVTIPAVLLLVSAHSNLLFAAYFVANLLLSPPPEVQREMIEKASDVPKPGNDQGVGRCGKAGLTPEKMADGRPGSSTAPWAAPTSSSPSWAIFAGIPHAPAPQLRHGLTRRPSLRRSPGLRCPRAAASARSLASTPSSCSSARHPRCLPLQRG